MRRTGLRIRIVCVLAAFTCVAALAAYGAQMQEQPEQKIPFSRVFVLNPFIMYEDVSNEQNLQKVDPAAQLIFDDLSAQWSADVFSNVGIENTGPAALSDAQMNSVRGSYDQLEKGAEDLVKQWKDKQQYLSAFQAIRNACGADCLLVQFVKVKVGDSGSWDFLYSGAVTPSTSATSIKLALIDLNSGKIWWSGASIEHSMPSKPSVKNLYKKAYEEFPGYQPKKGGRR